MSSGQELKTALISISQVGLMIFLAAGVLGMWVQYSNSSAPVRCFTNEPKNAGLKVLYIGNSFTFSNDMPKMFVSVLRSTAPDVSLKVHMAAFPAQKLSEHLHDARTIGLLKSGGPWDYVVLQEFSTQPFRAKSSMETACSEFDKLIKAQGAKTVLLETWADKTESQNQSAINDAYRTIGKKLGAAVIPAGETWWKTLEIANLYDKDRHHPSPSGSFLVACLAAKTLLNKNIVPIDSDSAAELHVPEATAKKITEIVNQYSPATERDSPRPD